MGTVSLSDKVSQSSPLDLTPPPEERLAPSNATSSDVTLEHSTVSPYMDLPNRAMQQLAAWSQQGSKIFLDVCSGFGHPLTAAIRDLQLPALAIDILLDSSMDLLDDCFFEQLLRLCGSGVVGYAAASPSCGEYSLLKLKPGGPPAQLKVQESALMLERCCACISTTFTAGGHSHLQQPSGAMSWREPYVHTWLMQCNAQLVLLAACNFGLDMNKTWLFATSFLGLVDMACRCPHGSDAHESIVGTRDASGQFRSRASAEYPSQLAHQFAQRISCLLHGPNSSLTLHDALAMSPLKARQDPPHSYVDGGGLGSSPDWSHPPPDKPNLFRAVRDHWIPKLLANNWHKRIMAHFLQKSSDPPFPSEWISDFRQSLSSLLPVPVEFDWTVREDQPLCLQALHSVSKFINDPDESLFPSLLEGVSTGYKEAIPPSNVFPTKEVVNHLQKPDLSIHLSNWQSAEDDLQTTEALVQEELEKGWLIPFEGSVEDAKQEWPLGVAIGKLGVATSPGRPPRLVVDSTVCGANGNCEVPEVQNMPTARDVMRCFPLRESGHELGGMGLDVKSAHKRVVVKHSHRGLIGFSFRQRLYFYRVCPFGAIFSAHWWGRLGSFWVRFLHHLIYTCHALWLFVDDFLLLQRWDILPVTASLVTLVIQAFNLPISWRKAELSKEVDWIGWRFNFSSGVLKLHNDKRLKLLRLIQELLQHSRVTKRALEKFVGLALWITQIFQHMRAFLHYIYLDIHKAPATQYSVEPGFWLTTISCLSSSLQFTSRPIGTAIPEGSQLVSIRHQPVKTLEDVQQCRLSDRRIWLRVRDPTSRKRTVSEDSVRTLKLFQYWLLHNPPESTMYPKPTWPGEAAADACAQGEMCQIGGFLRFPDGRAIWFSERWHPSNFHELGIPVSSDMQRDISCYEALAQIALLFALSRHVPALRLSVTVKSWSDNTGAEAGVNKFFSTKFPMALFLERLCLLCSSVHAVLDVSHIPGHLNVLADDISRWDENTSPPSDLNLSDRLGEFKVPVDRMVGGNMTINSGAWTSLDLLAFRQ